MQTKNLGFFRRNFFPVFDHEFKKLIPLNLLFFFATANYGILRVMKDAKIAGTGGGGLIAQVKLFGVLPVMILGKILYDKLSQRVGPKHTVYYILGYFGTFFFLFYFVLMDMADLKGYSEQASFSEKITKLWPWIFFYIHAELWGVYVLSISCWVFAARVMDQEQAKRCIITLSIGSAIATISAGILSIPHFVSGSDEVLIWTVLLFTALFVLTYYWLTTRMEKDPVGYQLPKKIKKEKKRKLGVVKSIKTFMKSDNSSYTGLMFMLVVGYAVSINLFEGVYKDFLKEIQTKQENAGIQNAGEYVKMMMAWQLIYIGIFSLVFTLVIAEMAKKRGWRFCAITVPILILAGTILFFGALYNQDYLQQILGWTELQVMQFVGMIAMVVVVCVKSIKYVLFDTTKELAYRPLDEESRLTGKSLVDGIGARLGKATGGLSIFTLEKFYHAEVVAGKMRRVIIESKGFLGTLIVSVVLPWIWAVFKLNKKKEKLEALRKREKKNLPLQ